MPGPESMRFWHGVLWGLMGSAGMQASLFEKPVNLEAAKASHSEFRYTFLNCLST